MSINQAGCTKIPLSKGEIRDGKLFLVGLFLTHLALFSCVFLGCPRGSGCSTSVDSVSIAVATFCHAPSGRFLR
jgi:hypothetical protein